MYRYIQHLVYLDNLKSCQVAVFSYEYNSTQSQLLSKGYKYEL